MDTTETSKAGDGMGVGGLQYYIVGRESLPEKVTFPPGLEVSEGVAHVDICGGKVGQAERTARTKAPRQEDGWLEPREGQRSRERKR